MFHATWIYSSLKVMWNHWEKYMTNLDKLEILRLNGKDWNYHDLHQ